MGSKTKKDLQCEVAQLRRELDETQHAFNLLEEEKNLYREISRSNGLNNLLDILGAQIEAVRDVDGFLVNLVDLKQASLICGKIVLPDEFSGIEKTYLKYKFAFNKRDANIFAYESKQALFVNNQNIDDYPESKPRFVRWKIFGMAFVPIIYESSTPIGTVQIFSQSKDIPLSSVKLVEGCLSFFCSQLKNSMRVAELERLEASFKTAQEEQKRFLEFVEKENHLNKVNEIYEHFTKELLRRYKFDLSGVVIRCGDKLVVKKSTIIDAKFSGMLQEWNEYYKNVSYEIDPFDGATATAYCNKIHLVIRDVMEIMHLPMSIKDKKALKIMKTPRTFIFMPILRDEEAIGVVWLFSCEKPVEVSENDLAVIKLLCRFFGAAIENAETYEVVEAQKNKISDLNLSLEQKVVELNESLENLKHTQDYLVQTEKMVALGGLVAGVAHEVNTPVGVGVTAASYLQDKTKELYELHKQGAITRSALNKYINLAIESTSIVLSNMERAAALIHSFKQVAVDQSSEELRVFNIKQYIGEILISVHSKFAKTPYKIEVICLHEFSINSYPGALSQVLTNLLMNSLIHGFDGVDYGTITIEAIKKGENVCFLYQDSGCGISEENIAHIYDPFFTTKRGQGGSGLGLQIVYNLVTQTLCGKIQCQSVLGEGTKFAIEFPANLEGSSF